MVGSPLPTPAAKATEVRRMFGAIAPRYDLLNHVLSFNRDRAWRRTAVDRLLETGSRTGIFLDACAGTLDLAVELADRAGFTGTVLAFDFSFAMLLAGRSKLAGRRIVPACADALDLPLAGASVDGAMVAFGVRNLSDLDAGLRELARVTRPGGHMLVSVMSLVGAIQAYADAVLEVTAEHGVDVTDRIVATGFLPEGPGLGHLAMRLFRWRELEELLSRHGEVVAASATGLIRPSRDPEDPELRALLARLELELAAEPGAIDCAPHMLAVVRR